MVDELVLLLDLVNGDRAVLAQLLDEVSQRDVLCPRGVVGTIAGHMKRRRVVDVGMNTVGAFRLVLLCRKIVRRRCGLP